MSPSISEIQDYILKQKADEEIDSKAKYRVTRELAENVKANKPLKQGRCNLCGYEDDRLVPCLMNVCMPCASKFIRNAGTLNTIKKEHHEAHCDYCMSRTFVVFYINPLICNHCVKRIGRTHKFDATEVKQEQEQFKKKMQEKGAEYI